MISQEDMMEVVQKYRGDAVVIPEERATRAWPNISTNKKRDVTADVMGKGSSLALGVALSQPDTKVIVFDGDGSLEMNLGTLVTVGEQQPRNFYHFVIENGMYATTGGQPISAKTRFRSRAWPRARDMRRPMISTTWRNSPNKPRRY